MSQRHNLRALLGYTAWANALMYDTLGNVPSEVLQAPRPGRLGNLVGTMAHIHVIGLIWKGHLTGRPHGFQGRWLATPPVLADLRAQQAEVDRWYLEYLDGLAPQAIGEVVQFDFVDGGSGAMPRDAILLHLVNHATYHKGQVADMLYESGLRPPVTDLPVYYRDVLARADAA